MKLVDGEAVSVEAVPLENIHVPPAPKRSQVGKIEVECFTQNVNGQLQPRVGFQGEGFDDDARGLLAFLFLAQDALMGYATSAILRHAKEGFPLPAVEIAKPRSVVLTSNAAPSPEPVGTITIRCLQSMSGSTVLARDVALQVEGHFGAPKTEVANASTYRSAMNYIHMAIGNFGNYVLNQLTEAAMHNATQGGYNGG
jgi:hypothetical protein